MRFLILVNATQDWDTGAMPGEKLISAVASSHEEPGRAGTGLDASRLQPSSKGWCIKHAGGQRSFVDGPFAETKELIAGYEIPDQQSGSRQDDGSTQRPRRRARGGAMGP